MFQYCICGKSIKAHLRQQQQAILLAARNAYCCADLDISSKQEQSRHLYPLWKMLAYTLQMIGKYMIANLK
eukprot:scaffold91841_cov22-Tisochrysis_lutea.AAC.1